MTDLTPTTEPEPYEAALAGDFDLIQLAEYLKVTRVEALDPADHRDRYHVAALGAAISVLESLVEFQVPLAGTRARMRLVAHTHLGQFGDAE